MRSYFKTLCCGYVYLGVNHSPIRKDLYCMNCGNHPKINELQSQLEEAMSITEELKESNDKAHKEIVVALNFMKSMGFDNYEMEDPEFQCQDSFSSFIFENNSRKQSTDQRIEKLKKDITCTHDFRFSHFGSNCTIYQCVKCDGFETRWIGKPPTS